MERLADAVAREYARFGVAAGMPRIVEGWQEAVGPTIARNAWPARISRDGTLHVATSSAAWAFELQQLEAEIVRRLRVSAGAAAPRGLRFAVGRLPEPSGEDAEARAARATPEPDAAELARAADLTRGIADEDLRKVVARAAAYSLSTVGSDRSF